MARNGHASQQALDGNAQTIRDVISPWAGVGPLPAPAPPSSSSASIDDDDEPETLPRIAIANYVSFGARVHAALLPLLQSIVGAEAAAWMRVEIAERGEPRDLVSALALGHALVTRINDAPSREAARHAVENALREVKTNSLMPPPVSASAHPPRSAELDRCRRER